VAGQDHYGVATGGNQVGSDQLLNIPTADRGARHMPKGEQRGNREAKKPKKEKPKTTAAAPSMKGTAGSSGGIKK
jgi:hypothetical protein